MKRISIILALLFVMLILVGCGASGYEAPLKSYFTAVKDENAEKYNNAFVDPFLEEYWTEHEYNGCKDADDILDLMDDRVKAENDEFKETVGKNISFKYDVVRVRKFNSEDVGFLAEYLEEYYGYDAEEVNDVAVLFVDFRANGDKDTTKCIGEEFVTVKISGKWYLSPIFSSLDSVKNAIKNIALD